MKRRSKSRLRTGNLAMGYCFSLPVMIFLFIFIFLSIAYCFYMSFFEWKLFDLGKDKTFLGLDNYIILILQNYELLRRVLPYANLTIFNYSKECL